MPEMNKQQPRLNGSIKLRFIASAIVLLILALGFNALLSLHSLEKLYVESIASQYSAIGKDLQRNLEKSLRFGKSLKKFIGIEKILEETRQNILKRISGEGVVEVTTSESPIEAKISVSIVLPDGSILYSTDNDLVGTTLPAQAMIDYSDPDAEKTSSRESNYLKSGNTYITPLSIRDRKKTWVATGIIAFDETQVKNLLNTVRNENIKIISIILGCSFVLLIVLFRFVTPNIRRIEIGTQSFPKFRLYLVMFLVIGSAQIIFSGWNIYSFRNYYLQINKQKTEMLVTLLKEDVEFLLSKGIRINKLVKMDVLMGEIIEASPELNDITIRDKDGNPLYLATKEGVIDFQRAPEEELKSTQQLLPSLIDPEYNFHVDLLKGDKVVGDISASASKEGYISTNLSKEVLFKKLWETTLDSATILVISFLFFVELLILIFQFIERQIISTTRGLTTHYRAVRPAAFLFLFGIDISITFLPLHMEKLYEPIFGLSKDIVMGLPISTEMFFAGISIFIAGTWLDRRGWHEPFLSGLFIAGMGVLYSWLAPNALHFIISRGIAGLGYGLAWMSPQGFVIAYTDENNRTQGLANMFAGILAGSICGGAAGAMLADRIGYTPVFLISAIIIFSVIGYTLLFMRNAMQKPTYHANEQTARSLNIIQTIKFLFNRNVLSLILFSAFPGALAIVGFLNYFSPIYLNRIGESQSNIGRIFMIYGICLIYIAPYISKYVDISENKKMYIIVTGILGGSAFVTFHFFGGIVATAAAILMLGLSASFGGSRRSYMLRLKSAQELGPGKAMGIFNSAARLGQVIGPVTFGWLLITMDINQGITYFGIAYLLITILFLCFAQSDRKIAVREDDL